jgi:hypothetical protein
VKRDDSPLAASTVLAAFHSYRLATLCGDEAKPHFIAGAAWALGKTQQSMDKMLSSVKASVKGTK